MATEATRTFKRKRIKLPDGNTVDIPVISQISFVDAADRGQETQYTIDNTTDSDRTVRVASIPGGGQPTDETGNSSEGGLKVERIDKFKLLDSADRGRETFPEPDSKTVQQPPDAPPYFTTHAKTHIVKYIKRNDDDSENSSIWIKSELIDAWSFVDAADRGQETQTTLNNPSKDNQAFQGLRFGTDDDGIVTISVDPSLEEITSGVGGSDEGDKPVRTDPFQNIVDFSGQEIVVFWSYQPQYIFATTADIGGIVCATHGPATLQLPSGPGIVTVCGWCKGATYQLVQTNEPFIGLGFPGNPPFHCSVTRTPIPSGFTIPDMLVLNGPWVQSINDGGSLAKFTYQAKGLTLSTPALPLYGLGFGGTGIGYWGLDLGADGLWANGWIGPGDDAPAAVPATVSASISANANADLGGAPWHCTKVGIAFGPRQDNGHGAIGDVGGLTFFAWFSPGRPPSS